jgi:hypothetical protein
MKRFSLLVALLVMVFACDSTFGQGADDCASAQVVPLALGDTVIVSVDNTAATNSPEPWDGTLCGAGVGTNQSDVWFSVTAPGDGVLSFSTCTTDPAALDTDLTIYTGTCGAPVQEACNGDACNGFGSIVNNIAAVNGTTYLVRVGGFGVGTVGVTDLEIAHFGTLPPTITTCTADPSGTVEVAFDIGANPVELVNIYIDGALASTCCALASGPQTITTAALGSGPHEICLENVNNSLPSPQVCCNAFVPIACPPTVTGTMVPVNSGGAFVGCVSCNAGGLHADNSYFRSFDMINAFGVSDDITVECVTTAIDASNATSGTQPVHVRLHIDLNGGGPTNFTYIDSVIYDPDGIPGTLDELTGATPDPTNTTMLMIYEERFDIPVLANELYNFAFGTGIVDPAGIGANDNAIGCLTSFGPSATLVVEIFTPDGQGTGNGFFMNGADPVVGAEIGSSYLMSAACGISSPVTTAAIGFATNRYTMDVGYSVNASGTCGAAGGVANLNCSQTPGTLTHELTWTDAGGAQSWTVEIDGNDFTLPQAQTSFSTTPQPAYQTVDAIVTAWSGLGGTGLVVNQRSCSLATSPANNWAEGALVQGTGTFIQNVTTPYVATTGQAWTALDCDTAALTNCFNDFFVRYTATNTGDVLVSTCNPGTQVVTQDTVLAVYTYDNTLFDDPTLIVACSDDQGLGTGTPAGTGGSTSNAACGALQAETIFPATAGTEYLIRLGTFNAAGIGPIEYTINDCTPATNLTADVDCATGDVTLNWTPNANASSQQVLRDGVLAGTPTATATTFTDTAVANGIHDYEIITDCGSGPNSVAIQVSVLVYSGQTDLIFAVEGLQNAGDFGAIDSGTALLTALVANGRNAGMIRGSWLDYACRTNAGVENVWIMTGTFPNDYRITQAEGDDLGALGAAGKNVYFEGGDQFGFVHVASTFDEMDGVGNASYGTNDGDDTFVAMDGADSGLGLDTSDLQNVPYNQDQIAGIDFTDQLTVAAAADADLNLTAAAAVWRLDDALGTPYITAIYGQGNAQGNAISSSFEFGGYGGDQEVLALRYTNALAGGGGTPQFKRGDCNADGGFNIADPIFHLGALFPTGTPNSPICRDACDANDDGSLNIADPIAMLGVLFPSTSPPPTMPAPGLTCGDDPTNDSLDCATSTGGC